MVFLRPTREDTALFRWISRLISLSETFNPRSVASPISHCAEIKNPRARSRSTPYCFDAARGIAFPADITDIQWVTVAPVIGTPPTFTAKVSLAPPLQPVNATTESKIAAKQVRDRIETQLVRPPTITITKLRLPPALPQAENNQPTARIAHLEAHAGRLTQCTPKSVASCSIRIAGEGVEGGGADSLNWLQCRTTYPG